MICPKCGAQNPDTSTFCEQCGSALSEQSAQPMTQPMQPDAGQQPQPFGEQPAYAAPVYSPVTTKKSKTVPIVIGICVAVVAVVLVLLFTVILPNAGGIKGKLKHKWTYTESGVSMTYDFKENTLSALGMLTLPIEWDLKGEDRITITMTVSMFGETQTDTEEYLFSLSSNGKELTLKDPDNPSDSMTLKRDD